MCGRYTLRDPVTVEQMVLRITGEQAKINARYNVAPSQMNPVVKLSDGAAHLVEMKWGLRPFWDMEVKPKFNPPINARSEEMFGKASFRQAVQERRCLVPADGFYEWHQLDLATRVPYYIGLKDGGPFFIAGLYEMATASRPDTYALLTRGPNQLMKDIHDRMPVILDEAGARRWIEPGPRTADEVTTMITEYPADRMLAFPVSKIVNSPKNDVPECIVPAAGHSRR